MVWQKETLKTGEDEEKWYRRKKLEKEEEKVQ